MKNRMKLEITAVGANESFARSTVAAFALSLNPSLSELSDIKTAVSEAVTNCIVHAYARENFLAAADAETTIADGEKPKDDGENGEKAFGTVIVECETEPDASGEGGILHIAVSDTGRGIEDVDRAMQPFFTTLPDEERSGMGFTVMQTFMDSLTVTSARGRGTRVCMSKKIGEKDRCDA